MAPSLSPMSLHQQRSQAAEPGTHLWHQVQQLALACCHRRAALRLTTPALRQHAVRCTGGFRRQRSSHLNVGFCGAVPRNGELSDCLAALAPTLRPACLAIIPPWTLPRPWDCGTPAGKVCCGEGSLASSWVLRCPAPELRQNRWVGMMPSSAASGRLQAHAAAAQRLIRQECTHGMAWHGQEHPPSLHMRVCRAGRRALGSNCPRVVTRYLPSMLRHPPPD